MGLKEGLGVGVRRGCLAWGKVGREGGWNLEMKKEALRVEGWMGWVARAAGQMTTCKLGETRNGDKYTQFASKQ